MKSIQWGILGCGDVTEKKSGPALQKIPGSRLVAVMRRDAAKAADYAKRHGVSFWMSDADALIHHPEVNAVYIATPPGSHAELALKVAAAGKPCYVEKPMGRNAREAGAMLAAFQAAGQPLYVAYYRRALARFVFVKEIIGSGQLGQPREIRYRFAGPDPGRGWRIDPLISGGGLFTDLGSHALDLFDDWLGPLGNVRSWNRKEPTRPAVAEQAGMLFECEGGVVGSATWNFACPQKEDRVELFGTEGVLSCSIFGHEPVRWQAKNGQANEQSFPVPDHIQQPLLEEVVAALQGKTTCRSTASSGLRTNEVMDLVLPERLQI